MDKRYSAWIFAAGWLMASTLIWLVAASSWISVTSFLWMNAAVLVVGTVVVKAVRAGRPTRSIAHVLYDAETPPGRAR
jgi:hypothetical protein